MTDELHLAGYREPLGLWVRKGVRIAAHPGLRTHALEVASRRARARARGRRGDRVAGRLILPAQGGGPYPLVLAQHALGDSAAGLLEALGASWGLARAAVPWVGFPLP